MAVVGIDFGNLNVSIAQAQRGGVDVILNESSNRQNPNMVAFSEKQRYTGEQAAPQARSNYQNTLFDLKRLIGRKFDEPEVQEEIKDLPFKVVKTPNGGIGFEVCYEGKQQVFTPEQVVAIMFKKVNQILTSANSNVGIADAVVGIPGWFTEAQRRALLDAAEVAGLNVLRLMHEGTAVALGYGIYKSVRNLFHESEPQHVLFLDLGHSTYTATVVCFVQGKLLVKSATFDRTLGGRSFDKVIVDFLAEKYIEKFKKDPRKNIKARLKLEAAAEKAKKTLSPAGVTEAAIHVECVLDDNDLSATLSLEEFERRCQPLLARLERPIRQALKESGVSQEQLAAVEIVGGGTRVNCVKQRLSSILGLDKNKLNYGLSTTLNADEAVSRGCALQAAILSSRFQVKPFEIVDAAPYSIKLSWEQEPAAMDTDASAPPADQAEDQELSESDNSVIVIKRNDKFPATRRITFRKSSDFTVTASYEDPEGTVLLPGVDPCVSRFKVSIPPSHQGEVNKVRLTFQYNIHGVLNLTHAQLMEELPPAPPAEVQEETKQEKSEGEDANAPAPAPAATEEKKDEPAGAKDDEASKPKKKYKTHSLTVVAETSGMSHAEKEDADRAERNMEQQDRLIKETSDMRNSLEAYIYDMKNKIVGALREYTTDDVGSSFNGKLEEMENWLYDEGFDCSKAVYADKLAELKMVGDPIERRADEHSRRDGAKTELLKHADFFKNLAKSTDDKYSHISDEERIKVREAADEAEGWLYNELNKQGEMPLHVDPQLTVAAIKDKQAKLSNAAWAVMNKPKPKPAPKEDEEKKAEEGEKKGEEGEAPATEGTGASEQQAGTKGAAEGADANGPSPMDTTG